MTHRSRTQLFFAALFLSLAFFSTTASACSYSINPASKNFNSSAGTGSFTLTASSSGPFDFCLGWSAVSNNSFITVTSPPGGVGGAGTFTINYAVTANGGAFSRSGTISIEGFIYTLSTFTVTQSGTLIIIIPPCLFATYAISPTSTLKTAVAGSGSVSVTDSSSCGWSAVSNDSWISITSAASGTGNGTVSYTVGANPGVSARTGTMTIAGKTFTVNQNGTGCTYSIVPTSNSLTANGGSGSFNLTASPLSCTWTAVSNDPSCIYGVSPGSGTGNATINYSVAGNSGTVPFSCTMSAGGQTFTVNLGGCTYLLGPTSLSAGSGAASGTVAVTASGFGCAWSATSNAAWITVTSGLSGSGTGTVGYSLAANSGAARTGTVTIGGQTFTVTQAAGAGTLGPNYSDSWWSASESGWGITITDHDTNAFVQWYTYDATGHNQKYVIAGGTFSSGKCQFTGAIQHVTGPSWTLPTFDPLQVVRTTVGLGTIDFCPVGLPAGTIVFFYTADGVTGSKQLTRLSFGNDVPHWAGTANTGAADFTDLWWNISESGWGVSVTQHGNNIFFRVFVYDTDNLPLLFVVSGVTFDTATSFSGALQLTTGPSFAISPFDPTLVVRTTAGSATLTFSDANNGVLSYTVGGVTKTKTITRLSF